VCWLFWCHCVLLIDSIVCGLTLNWSCTPYFKTLQAFIFYVYFLFKLNVFVLCNYWTVYHVFYCTVNRTYFGNLTLNNNNNIWIRVLCSCCRILYLFGRVVCFHVLWYCGLIPCGVGWFHAMWIVFSVNCINVWL
jgi:hypothetical protein